MSSIIKAMLPDQHETQTLLAGARDGDENAANRLLERHRDALRRMVEARLDNKIRRRVDASDIVQDTLMEASRRLRDYLADPGMPFHLWLRQIARDRMIDAHRRHRASAKRSVDREQRLARAVPNRSTIDLAEQLCDPEMTPATAATMQELQLRFQVAIEELGEQDREIVLMRHFEHLTNQEVAETLALSGPAASMRYLRAMRRLRELLGEDGEVSR